MNEYFYTMNEILSMNVVHEGGSSKILDAGDGRYIKIFTKRAYGDDQIPESLRSHLLELSNKKISIAYAFSKLSKNIDIPTGRVFVGNHSIGCTLTPRRGRGLNTFFANRKRTVGLNSLALIFENTEKIVREAHLKNIVFPDLATESNILVDDDYSVTILDYDGFQIRDLESPVISTQIEGAYDYLSNSKHYSFSRNRNAYWDPNLDKFSLMSQFLLLATNINITMQPYMENRIDELLDMMGIDDKEILEKFSILFADVKNKPYFGDAYKRIADLYDLERMPGTKEKQQVSRFVRK